MTNCWPLPLVAALAFACLPTLATAQSNQPSQPQQGSDISVQDSPGAITGQNINIGTVYQIARRDPVTEQFVTTLRDYNRFVSDLLRQSQAIPIYMVAIDGELPRLRDEPDGAAYLIVAAAGDLEDLGFSSAVDRCEIRDGVNVVAGIVASSGAGMSGRTRGRMVTREDRWPVLSQMCAMLRRPASSLIGGGDDNSESVVFDLVTSGIGFVALQLVPEQLVGPDMEREAIGHYWNYALAARYVRVPRANSAFSITMLRQLRALGTGRWAELPFALPLSHTPPPPPPQARREFGPRIDRLERDWSAYLAGAAMTIGNERRPIVAGGQWTRLVPRFRLEQVGSPEFWQRADDFREFAGQLNCLASHFLLDRSYVAPDAYTVPGQCPRDEIRLSE